MKIVEMLKGNNSLLESSYHTAGKKMPLIGGLNHTVCLD